MSTRVDEFPNSKIVRWFSGRSIFITGGTGFMGKVLVEKLLWTCRDIGNLYILMRPKRGRTVEQRIEDMWKLPCFQRLRDSFPTAINKIIPVHGDLVTDDLGLSAEDLSVITENVSVVFHCAATLKLEACLKDAVEQNTAGTQRVVDVARRIKNLACFMHTSTAFCSADLETFDERVYPCKDNPRDVIEVTRWMNNDALDAATKQLIKPHPNTYTYSKRLAETLVANENGRMRVCIVRPSIVTPAGLEPTPGWVDTLNGPMGLMVAAGKGVLRSMHCNGSYRAHIVPVDIAINAMIVIAYNLGSAEETPKEVPVYNFTNDGVIQKTWSDVLDIGRSVFYDYPFEMMIWYPDGDLRSNYYWHQICCFFMHWIPAYFIDFLMFVFRQKRFMVRVQRKIADGLELLQFFTTRQWHFASEQFLALTDGLSDLEKEMFPMNFKLYSVEEYMRYCIIGTRQYCMKEDLKSIPRCRIQQSILYVLDRTLAAAFYIYLIYFILNRLDVAEQIFDFIGGCLQHLPLIGSLVA